MKQVANTGFRYIGSGVWNAPTPQSIDTIANTIAIENVTQFSAWGIGIEDTTEHPTVLTLWQIGARSGVALLTGLGALFLAALGIARRRRLSRGHIRHHSQRSKR